ncbi:MAG TPA: xanthine dehydrogenase family protein subunit M [Gemmatimonadota bacterium]|nr:xanthine dehydrogenase family protein subunit M [Gemmatimonadota bacterium]
MKPAPFDYVRPDSIEGAIDALREGGPGAKALAGGQSLIPALNFRLAQPSLLVDLAGVDALRGIRSDEDGGLTIGAMTRQRTVERSDVAGERAPLVSETMALVAHPQIRNRGTLGGSLAHADPAAELPAAMLALDAVFRLHGPAGSRRVPARDFYIGLFETVLAPDELLVEIEIPAPPPGSRFAIEEVSRRHGDFALAGVAIALTPADDGSISDAAIGLFGVGDRPILSTAGNAVLRGRSLDAAAIAEAAEATADALDPPGDIHASPAYRRHLVRVLTRRALERANEARETRDRGG